jgi:hypothetical protein
VRQPAAVAKEIATLARNLCLFDPIAPVPTERLVASEWQASAERIERLLFENSKVELAEGIIDEIVIVPDGMLWYLPFELLPVGSARAAVAGQRPPRPQAPPVESTAALSRDGIDKQPDKQPESRRLHDVCRIRYCPTRSLAVLRFETPKTGGPVGIYTGRLVRGDKPAIAQEWGVRKAGCFALVEPDGVVEAVWSGVSRQGFRDLAGRIGVEPTLPDELLVDVPGAATAGCPLVYGDPLPPLVGPAPHPFPETSR